MDNMQMLLSELTVEQFVVLYFQLFFALVYVVSYLLCIVFIVCTLIDLIFKYIPKLLYRKKQQEQ